MKKIIRSQIWLIFSLLIAMVLRIWQLGIIPPHLSPDEASLGYNAYSILKTGKDEYGTFLPVIFKSFGDFKPGLYVYLTVPFVGLFGLNEFAVRFPSALAGIVSVFLLYLIVKRLFSDEKLALISSFIMAVNPWSIFFSRGAWEVNVALCLTLAGIYFFFKSFEKSLFFVLSVLFFSLTLTAYQGAKLSTGIVVLILLWLYWKDIIKTDKKAIASGLVVGFVVSVPIILSFFQGGTGRLDIFNVFSYPRPKDYLQNFLNEGNEQVGSINYYLFHSEILNFVRGILGRFFNHFSARFLFFEGDWANPQHSAPYQGVFLLGDIILLLTGTYALLRSKIRKEHLFVVSWLFLSTLPSILSRDQVHTVRALNMSIPLIIVLSYGAYEVLQFKKKAKILIALMYFSGFVYFLDAYFIHMPKHYSQYWQYGYRQMVETITPIQGNYKEIRVQQSFSQPYIYFLFFQKYDPARYQANAKLVPSEFKNDVGYVLSLDNIKFVPIDWSIDRGDHGDLVVGDPVRIPPEDSKDENQFKLIKEIKFLNGATAFRMIEVK